jgi:CRP-like cAMP-binding protein
MRPGSLLAALSVAPPFAYMDAQAVAAFAAVGRIAECSQGDQLFHERQSPMAVLVVLSGVVYICTFEAEGNRVVEAVMAPVESFGWLSLVDPGQRTLNAMVGGRATLLTIAKRDVLDVLDRYPHAWRGVARFLAERLRRTLASQRALAGFPLDRRIAFVLCQAFRLGVPGTTSLDELALTQHNIASMTATSRQSVNRQLRRWAGAGLVEVGYNSLRVLDPDALLRLALAGAPP